MAVCGYQRCRGWRRAGQAPLRALLLTAVLLASGAPDAAANGGDADAAVAPRWALSLFGGRFADNDWTEIATLDDVGFRDAWMAGAALSREIAGTRRWALEIEGQALRHFGDQAHWEFNAVLATRWRAFPWDGVLPTAAAFGIGPSLATEVPDEEVARDGESERLLLYWMAELEASLPGRPWRGFARLHHRSNAYGLLAEDGGSNIVTLGLRRRF
jgi:hypothetical protein